MTRKTVFITGADRGIGLSLCEKFVSEGWTVFAGQYMPEWNELTELQKKLREKELHRDNNAASEQLYIIPLNVGDQESVQRAAKLVAKQTDHLDMLINCAGVYQNNGREGARNSLNINSIGPIRMVDAFLPMMENGERRLCFFSSEAGSVSLAHRKGDISYCTSKTALNMAIRLMHTRLAPDGYRFRLYHPGWVRSYMSGTKSTVGNFEPEEAAEVAYQQFVSDRTWEDVLILSDVKNEIWPF